MNRVQNVPEGVVTFYTNFFTLGTVFELDLDGVKTSLVLSRTEQAEKLAELGADAYDAWVWSQLKLGGDR